MKQTYPPKHNCLIVILVYNGRVFKRKIRINNPLQLREQLAVIDGAILSTIKMVDNDRSADGK